MVFLFSCDDVFRENEVLREMKLTSGREYPVHNSVNHYTTVNHYTIGMTGGHRKNF